MINILTEAIAKIKNNKGFIKYFKNTLWYLIEKLLRLIFGLFVGVWVARYLGPKQYGQLNYVIAFVGLFTPLSKLGLDGIISREVAKNDNNTDSILSTTLLLKLIVSIILVFISSFYMLFSKKDLIYFYLSIILSSTLVFKSFEVLEFYFRAKVKAKYISIATIFSLTLSSIIKIYLIIMKFSLIYFAIINLVEVLFIAIILFGYFLNENYVLSLRKISLNLGQKLIKESWPLIIGSFFAIIYLNIDKVMIEGILDSSSVGQYSAAVKVSTIWYFIPMSIGWSIQTAIVNAKKINEKLYYTRLQLLTTVTVIIAYLLIIPIAIFSKEIIFLLFGENYIKGGEVLVIHIFSSLFIFLNVGRSLWILNESYFKFEMSANILGGILNIVLNLYFIKKFGIVGAAWATLCSYLFSFFLSGAFFSQARRMFIIQLKSIFLIDVMFQFKKLLKEE